MKGISKGAKLMESGVGVAHCFNHIHTFTDSPVIYTHNKHIHIYINKSYFKKPNPVSRVGSNAKSQHHCSPTLQDVLLNSSHTLFLSHTVKTVRETDPSVAESSHNPFLSSFVHLSSAAMIPLDKTILRNSMKQQLTLQSSIAVQHCSTTALDGSNTHIFK